ncbi:hypothetical protein [Ekhidna sp.]|uniref:hypothetical protein n=1 Tax=Ekhidna sp. TaxID=2608089 RepID=UPI00329A7138
MKTVRKLSFPLAYKTIVLTLILTMIFHICILIGVIPYDIVWGGRLDTQAKMILFEIISLVINSIILLFVFMKKEVVKPFLSIKIINVFIWLFAVIFLLNTIGNLFASNSLETIIFTPLTLILTICMVRMAIERKT